MAEKTIGGDALDKWIFIDEITATSFRWQCVKGEPASGIYFRTCDDCIDYLVCGVDEDNFAVGYIRIPEIGAEGVFAHSFVGDIRVGLAQVYTEEQAQSVWRTRWESFPIIYTPEEERKGIPIAIIVGVGAAAVCAGIIYWVKSKKGKK